MQVSSTPQYEFAITEVALLPTRSLKDRLCWLIPAYRDRYWQKKIQSARRVGKIKLIDINNHKIVVEHKGA